jgi:formate-dependent nitrite reductase membrane component NrfD
VIVPLVLSWRTHLLGARSTVIAAVLVLIGGLVLRYAIVMAGQQVAVAGR